MTTAADATAPAPVRPLADAELGPTRNDSLVALLDLARALGLPEVWKRLSKDLEFDGFEERVPEPGNAPAGAEATIEAARQTLLGAARPSPERTARLQTILGRNFFDEKACIPEDALEAANWAEPLAELIALVEPPHDALAAALALLPARVLEARRAVWEDKAARLDPAWANETFRQPTAVLVRGAAVAAVIGPVLTRLASAGAARANGGWEFPLAALYVHHGDEGRAAALRALEAVTPPPADGYYRCHTSSAAYRYLFRQAWMRRDADLVSTAVARLMVPVYFKGKRPMIPAEETLRYDRVAPSEGTAPPAAELPLTDVVGFVARERPDRLAEGLALAGQAAAAEKGARALLDAAVADPTARAAVEKRVTDVVELLEAPKEMAVKSGLELLATLAPLLDTKVDAVFRGVEWAVSSASPGVVQAAATLLAAVAAAHPARSGDAVRLLEECLHSTNVPTAEIALRALARVAGHGAKRAAKKPARTETPLALSKAARERIAELAKEEPKRLGPLADALLG